MNRRRYFKKAVAGVSVFTFVVSAAAPAVPAKASEISKMTGEISVNPEERYQTLKGWGTSLCWWGNVIGSWGDQDFNGNGRADREEIAELAFSPEYLNLNIVRYNVGGGDKENTSIKRCEGLVPGWTEDMTGSRDASKAFDPETFYAKETGEMADAGQIWMLEQANAYRVKEGDIINEVFSNSPPYYMTKSGSSTGGYSWDLNNLKEDQYDDFARYMARATKWIDNNLKSKYGTGVTFVEPLNEPDTTYWQDGSTKQEGCIFNTGELQSKAYREMKTALEDEGLSHIEMTGTDETALWNAINSFSRLDDDIKEQLTTIGAHTYSGNDSERKELRRLAEQYDKDLWMSEVTKGGGAHTEGSHESMEAVNARSQSEGIMADLKYMQPTAWIAWLVADSEYECLQTNSNWGLLHAVFEKDGPVPDYHTNLVNQDGSKKDWVPEEGYWAVTKQFYTMMQYSKYLKAGYRMIQIDDGNMCAAISPKGDELVIVAQNFGSERKTSVDLYHVPGAEKAEIYRTSDGENCELVETQDVTDGVLDVELPHNSVATYVIRGAQGNALCSLENYHETVEADVVKPEEAWTKETGKFVYEGSWGESAEEYGGGKYSTNETAAVTFTFKGRRAAIYGTKALEGALTEVLVDGQKVGEVSCIADKKDGNVMLFDTGSLSEGIHTVTIRKAEGQGDKLIEINSAKVIYGELDVDVTSLRLAVQMAERMEEEQKEYQCYTKESWKAVEEALNQARVILNPDNKEVTQEKADEAFLNLITAWNLLENGVQKAGLKAVIEGARIILEDTESLTQYEEKSIEALKKALQSAELVYNNDGVNQEAVNAASTSLLSAVTSLLVREEDSRLDVLIQKAEELLEKEDQYTPSSILKLREALEAVKKVASDSQSTDTQLSEAYENLAKAMTGLVRRGNKGELKNALDKAEEILNASADYLKESIAGLAQVRDAAQAVYDDPESESDSIGRILKELIQEILKARLTGDVDQNGEVNSEDAAEVLRANAELETLTEEQCRIADVNEDGQADSMDAGMILQYTAEKIDSFR